MGGATDASPGEAILIQLDDQRNQVVNQGSLRNGIALVDS